MLLVVQGMDTSGKGGIMRHVVAAVDPQGRAASPQIHDDGWGRLEEGVERQHGKTKDGDACAYSGTRVLGSRLIRGKGQRVDKQPGRNEPCYCGSGKKFKLCHGR